MKERIRISQTKGGRYQVAHKDPQTQKRVRNLYNSLPEADKAKAQVQLRLDKYHISEGKVYVGHALKRYLEQFPESILIARKNSFLSFCRVFNHFEVKDLTTEALRRWFEILRMENSFTNKTLSCVKINLNSLFKWLVAEGYLPSNTLAPIMFKVRRALQRPRVILSDAEIKDMLVKLRELSPNEVLPFIYTLVQTGARKNEIRTLEWEQVDFGTGFINLRNTKNGRDRAIKMSDHLRKFLFTLKDGRESGYLFYDRKDEHLGACVALQS